MYLIILYYYLILLYCYNLLWHFLWLVLIIYFIILYYYFILLFHVLDFLYQSKLFQNPLSRAVALPVTAFPHYFVKYVENAHDFPLVVHHLESALNLRAMYVL